MRRPIDAPINITTEFGVADSYAKFGRHSGVDYSKGTGSNVYAPTSGVLTQIVSPTGGNMVVIRDNQGLTHRLMHNSQFIKPNGGVSEGELVAKSGTTGLSTGPHVHWDINKEGNYPTAFSSFINPADWLATNQGGNMAEKANLSTARILAEEVLGRDRDFTHAGKGDADLNANHVNRDLSNQYIYDLWNSQEAKASAGQKAAYKSFYDTYASKIAELSARPTKEELASLGEALKVEQAKVVAAEQKLADELAKDEASAEENVRGFFGKLVDLIFRKG